MLYDKERGRLRPSDKQIIQTGKSIWNYLKAPEEYGTKNNHGRPKKLTIRQQRLLVRKASAGKFSELN